MTSTRRHILAAITISTALLAALTANAQTEGWIRGTVTLSDGTRIAGVTVTLTTPADPEYRVQIETNKKGKFSVQVANAALPYDLRLAKDGYTPLLTQVQATVGGTTTVDAVLIKEDASQPEKVHKPVRSAADAYKEGVDALRADDLETAVARLRETVELAPDVAEPHVFLAQALLQQGEPAASAAEAERALELEPGQARALFVRYQAYHALGDEQRAADALAALKGSDQAEGAAKRIFNEGVAAYSDGDYDTAEGRFLVATELDPSLPEAFLALGEIYRLRGNTEQSLAMADRVLDLIPGDARALRLRFSILLDTQRSDELRAALDALAAADPEWATSRLPEIAQSAFNDDRMAAARVLYEKVIQADPDNARAHYTLGLCYFNLGDTAHAREQMARFLELAPDDPDAASARSMLQYME